MKRWLLLSFILILGHLIEPATAAACAGEPETPFMAPRLIFDLAADDALGGRRLRTTADPLPGLQPPPATGLGQLRASASGQFSVAGWEAIAARLRARGLVTEDTPLTVLDLRQEPHGFLNAEPISWHLTGNACNRSLAWPLAAADEGARLQALRGIAAAPTHRTCKQQSAERVEFYYTLAPMPVTSVLSEADWLGSYGVRLVRLPMVDHTGAPEDPMVEAFIQLLDEREATWLHLHCRGGKGRTGVFLLMLDSYYNAHQLPLEVMAARQAALGGKNVLELSAREPAKSRARRAFLYAFYRFVGGARDLSWTAWRAQHAPGPWEAMGDPGAVDEGQ